jgi:mono/diheme cytochrome c family protein
MGNLRPTVIASAIAAAVLIGILVGVQIPPAQWAPAPQAVAAQPASHAPAPGGHEATPMKVDAVVQRGQQVFAHYCVPCHGAEGKGDGVSAQNLPIRPQDLTVGAQLNPLPDRFLFEIIAHGAQTVGLSPLMPAFTPYLSEMQIEEVIRYVRTLAKPPFDPKGVLPIPEKREGPVQPIFFSHVIHAGSMQIACQYCHANARRSSTAGIPSVERCMGCHKIVAAQGNPEVQKLQGYWERQEPIPWVRVFKLPEFADFTHKAHVRAGVQCQTCHGRIEAMERVGAVTGRNLTNDLLNLTGMSIPPTKLTMGWCVECHRSVNVNGVEAVQNVASLPVASVRVPPGSEKEKRKAPLECVSCHH